VRGHIDAIKQNIETITGVRGKPIPQLATGASSDDITAKVNSILSLLQNTGQSAAKSILPPDPTDAYFQPKVWVSGPDLVLGIGQHTSDSFTSETSMPLHIACGDGQIYEIQFNGVAAAAASGITILQPNNAVPTTNLFTIGQLFGSSTGSGANYSTGSADSGFRLNAAGSLLVATIVVSVQTVNKNTKSTYISAVGGTAIDYFGDEFSLWQDTTTVWSSLGTIIQPNAWTGTITVRRVA